MKRLLTGVFCLCLSDTGTAAGHQFALDIKGTSLAELMNLKVTSLSRKKEALNQAPAAVYVLTHDQIQRMGVTHIAEALRYVPGVEVARLGANQWAISIRGFNSRTANKLLVMIDGRSIYNPLFSGVFWEEKDLLLNDIDRIEVIRGPGGTQWGANAVNGVINIITRHAADTQGGLVTVGGGSEERHLLQARYGWRPGEETFARGYGKWVSRDDSKPHIAQDADDQGDMAQAGFRLDHRLRDAGELTLQGDVYRGEIGDYHGFFTNGEAFYGGNLQLDWSHWSRPDRHHEVQLYYDHTRLETRTAADRSQVWSLDYQVLQRWTDQELVAGFGYRRVSDEVQGSFLLELDPPEQTDDIKSAFVQHDVGFLDSRLHLIVGTKYEVNDYSGEEWQPSIRTAYSFDNALLWAAWSRAVRTPTRLERSVVLPTIQGNPELNPEYATVYEIGWRGVWQDRWQLDLTGYLNQYDDLIAVQRNTTENSINGQIRGLEALLHFQARRNWLLALSYSINDTDLRAPDGRASSLAGSSPQEMFKLTSYWDISAQWQLNGYLRYIDELPARAVDSYWAGDLSLVWRPDRRTSLQLVARHLGNDHNEWGPTNRLVEPDVALYVTREF